MAARPAARVTDMTACPMVAPGPVPHVGGPIIPPCCSTVIVCGMPQARVGDKAICAAGGPATIVSGSPTVFIGGAMAARIGDTTSHGGAIVTGCPTVLIGDVGGAMPSIAAGKPCLKAAASSGSAFVRA